MTILALDQSLANTGFVVMDKKGAVLDHGVIQTKKENQTHIKIKGKRKKNPKCNGLSEMQETCRRTEFLTKKLIKLVHKHAVHRIVVEEYFGFTQSKSAADGLATSRTVVIAVAVSEGVELVYVSQKNVKLAASGNPQAQKEDMIEAAADSYPHILENYVNSRTKTGYNTETEHLADALGVWDASQNPDHCKELIKKHALMEEE